MSTASITYTQGTVAAAQAFTCPRGEDLVLTITCLTAAGTARDCSGSTLSLSWERAASSGAPFAVTGAGSASGIHTLTIPHSTTLLQDGLYRCDTWLTPASGASERIGAISTLSLQSVIGPDGATVIDQLILDEIADATAPKYGTTAARPAAPLNGELYFDTTLGYPLWWNGSAWIDGFPDSWDDVIGPIDFAASVAALTIETYRDTPVLVSSFRHDQDDALTLRYQMPHGWDLGIVDPHLHFIPAAAASGNMILDGYIAWSHAGTLALPALSGWTPFTVTKAIASGDQWIEQVVSLGSCVPPTAAQSPSAQLWVYLRRPGNSNPLDTYSTNKVGGTTAANVVLAAADCHVRRNRAGTDSEWT